MFFPHRITSLAPTDLVLEIGPGTSPHPRANVFLEMRYQDESEFVRQVGGATGAKPAKDVVLFDGNRFPFADQAFDYVICSHVIEHVTDVPAFVSEMVRVGKAGYLEYPTILYEYLYNFRVHLNLVNMRDGTLIYLPKDETSLESFFPVQKVLYRSLELGYTQLVDALAQYMFDGCEWRGSLPCRRALSLDELTRDVNDLPPNAPQRPRSVRNLLARVASAMKTRMRDAMSARSRLRSPHERAGR
jgi:SAM-dependent methyltransferase